MSRLVSGLNRFALALVLSSGFAQTAFADELLELANFVVAADEHGATRVIVLDGGKARIRATASSLDDATIRIVLKVRNPAPKDVEFPDDLILNYIRLDATRIASPITGSTTIQLNDIHLRPDGKRLRYEVTMKRPSEVYKVRIVVNGLYNLGDVE